MDCLMGPIAFSRSDFVKHLVAERLSPLALRRFSGAFRLASTDRSLRCRRSEFFGYSVTWHFMTCFWTSLFGESTVDSFRLERIVRGCYLRAMNGDTGSVPILLHVAILPGLRSGDLLRYLCDVELMIFDNQIKLPLFEAVIGLNGVLSPVLLFSDDVRVVLYQFLIGKFLSPILNFSGVTTYFGILLRLDGLESLCRFDHLRGGDSLQPNAGIACLKHAWIW
ncbi:hypothetical protein NL676_021180 [Syzygium grande]|nr:hypothetical protein NL676_021180 [Syzygium grande]